MDRSERVNIKAMFFWLWLIWLVLSIFVLTGKPHRWLRAKGLGRHKAAVGQALVLAGSFMLAWVSFDPRLNTSVSDFAVMFGIMFLLQFGGILLWLRQMRLS